MHKFAASRNLVSMLKRLIDHGNVAVQIYYLNFLDAIFFSITRMAFLLCISMSALCCFELRLVEWKPENAIARCQKETYIRWEFRFDRRFVWKPNEGNKSANNRIIGEFYFLLKFALRWVMENLKVSTIKLTYKITK